MKLGEACIAANYYKTLEITRFKKKMAAFIYACESLKPYCLGGDCD